MAASPRSLIPSERTVRRRKKLDARQRIALELAQELAELAEQHQEYRSDLFQLAHRIRAKVKRSPDEEYKAILKAIKYENCLREEDIHEETDISLARVKEIVAEMIDEGAAVKSPRTWIRGPQVMLIYLTGKAFKGIVA